MQGQDRLGGKGILLDYHGMSMAGIEALHACVGSETIPALIVGRDVTCVGAFI